MEDSKIEVRGTKFTEEQLVLLKELTGKTTYSEAAEHFIVICLEFFLIPEQVLATIIPKVNPLMAKDYIPKEK